MPKSAHFINKRTATGREGLSHIEGHNYGSCCWAISEGDAASLQGGWIYLHETKADRSAFGGVILGSERADRIGAARDQGYVIYFEVRAEGRGMAWRGANHGMAWWSGLVEASAPHEFAREND